MLRINTKVWSHQSVADGQKKFVSDVLLSEPLKISSFRELVGLIAQISFRNPEHVLFFRGQKRNYSKKIKDKGKVSSFYPSIYRSIDGPLGGLELQGRFASLEHLSNALLIEFTNQKIEGHEKLSKFPELAWAVLQHYEVCPTPLLDVTHSLRVAASFALNGNNGSGYLYVFGFPHPNGSITYSTDLELINLRLLSICPPEAHRPYFQEGFLVGSFPSRRMVKHPNLDVGIRLIAKFKLDKSGFWDANFSAIPNEALYPKDDRVEEICKNLKQPKKTKGPLT